MRISALKCSTLMTNEASAAIKPHLSISCSDLIKAKQETHLHEKLPKLLVEQQPHPPPVVRYTARNGLRHRGVDRNLPHRQRHQAREALPQAVWRFGVHYYQPASFFGEQGCRGIKSGLGQVWW